MPGDDERRDHPAGPSAATPPQPELLACVACRSRKLKCDRRKPACTRCAKVSAECVYPESRRKPASKRRNVKELEARLAQVEDILKDVGKAESERKRSSGALRRQSDDAGFQSDLLTSPQTDESTPYSYSGADGSPFPKIPVPPTQLPRYPGSSEIMGTGMSEPPPPFEMAEALHRIFFEEQGHYFPIVHAGRYLRAFHLAPHLRPPMCLQYAIWSLAAFGHQEYGQYSEVFYQRARQYLQADEMRVSFIPSVDAKTATAFSDSGEHFMTVSHAQAWELIATREAQNLAFTRASMSTARCVKLCQMMGLHRMDDEYTELEMVPTIPPAQDFAEQEERRRVFWGAFCIDSHASVNTGWPALFDYTQVTTLLPCSEEAFRQGIEESSCTLEDALNGSSYSTFAAAAFICHLYNQILRHVQGDRKTDRPEDVESGPFWRRHRDLDLKLSTAFMFLPERLRLPRFHRNPVAIHTNLNLHAAVVCLHNAVCDRVDVYSLPDELKRNSEDRLLSAGNEIVSIMKMTSHNQQIHKSPHVAMSLYCAITVYIYRAKQSQDVSDLANIEFLIKSMEATGRQHIITTAFLAQALLDIEVANIPTSVKLPWFDKYIKWDHPTQECSNMIPLLASRRSKILWPMPGRPPISTIPRPNELRKPTVICGSPMVYDPFEGGNNDPREDGNNKRRRMQSPEPGVDPVAASWLKDLQELCHQESSPGVRHPAASAWKIRTASAVTATAMSERSGRPIPHRGNMNSPVVNASAASRLASMQGGSAATQFAGQTTSQTASQSTSYRTASSSRIGTSTQTGSENISNSASMTGGSTGSSREPVDVNLLGNLFGAMDQPDSGWDMSNPMDTSNFSDQLMDIARGGLAPEAAVWSLLTEEDLALWNPGETEEGDGG